MKRSRADWPVRIIEKEDPLEYLRAWLAKPPAERVATVEFLRSQMDLVTGKKTPARPNFKDFIVALRKNDVDFVIVGTFALAFHGWPMATTNLDIWIRPGVPGTGRLLRAIVASGFQSQGVDEEILNSGEVVRVGVYPVCVNIRFRLDGLTAEEIWTSRQKGPFGRHVVHYLGRAAFIKNKRAAGRPKDLADLAALGEKPGP